MCVLGGGGWSYGGVFILMYACMFPRGLDGGGDVLGGEGYGMVVCYTAACMHVPVRAGGRGREGRVGGWRGLRGRYGAVLS